MKTKRKPRKREKGVVIKFTASRMERAWLKEQAGRGNVAEYIRSKLFEGAEYPSNKLPAARSRWELATALIWVGNNLQEATEKIDGLAKGVSAGKPGDGVTIAITSMVRLLHVCARSLIQICEALSPRK